MKPTCLAAVLATAVALAAGTGTHARAAEDPDEKVTVVGCAVKGDGDGDGFLLANAVKKTTETTTEPGVTGAAITSSSTTTEMKASRVLYWLDDDDDKVEAHFGHQIEITGDIEGDIEEGKVAIEREDDAVEIEIDADGRKSTVRLSDVPSAVGTSGSVEDDEQELKYLVRKLDVKSVRMIAPTCQ